MQYELERAEDEAAPELARITPHDRETGVTGWRSEQ